MSGNARSSGLRTSARTNSMLFAASRGRFSSEPLRMRLSAAMIRAPGYHPRMRNARFDPTNPAPPVTKMHAYTASELRERSPHVILSGAQQLASGQHSAALYGRGAFLGPCGAAGGAVSDLR